MPTSKHDTTSSFDEEATFSTFDGPTLIVPNAAPAPDLEQPRTSIFKSTKNSYRAFATANTAEEQPSNPVKLHNTPPPPPLCCGMLSLKHCCCRFFGLLLFVGITVGAAALIYKAVSDSDDSVLTPPSAVVTIEPAKDVVGATPAPIDRNPEVGWAPPLGTFPPQDSTNPPGVAGSGNPPQVATKPPTPTYPLAPAADGNGIPSPGTIPPQGAETQPPTPAPTFPQGTNRPTTPVPTFPQGSTNRPTTPVPTFPQGTTPFPSTPAPQTATFHPTSGAGLAPPSYIIPPQPINGGSLAPPLPHPVPPQDNDDDGSLHHPPPPHPSGENNVGCDENWHNHWWDRHDSPAHAMNLWDYGGSAMCKNDFDAQCKANPWTRFVALSGTGSMWFKATAQENSICPGNVEHLVTLTVPEGDDYDLKVYKSTTGFHQTGASAEPDFFSATSGAGLDEVVLAFAADGPEKDDFEYYVFVEYRSGTSCAPWTLVIDGHDCWDSHW